jgi:histidinol-phosphate aminotransferase
MSSVKLSVELLKLGTVVKPWKQKGFENFIRVSIGSVIENDQFIKLIKAFTKAD